MTQDVGPNGLDMVQDDAARIRELLYRLPELIAIADLMGMETARDLLRDAERAARDRLEELPPARPH